MMFIFSAVPFSHCHTVQTTMDFLKIAVFLISLQIISAALVRVDNYQFMLKSVSNYEVQQTVSGLNRDAECCIYCRRSFLCQAAIFTAEKNCNLVAIIAEGAASGSGWEEVPEGAGSDTPEGAASDIPEGGSDTSDTMAYVLQSRPPAIIQKIEIKTSNEDHADTKHQVGLEICTGNSQCCKLEPSQEDEEHFQKDALDSFTDGNLLECQGFGITSLENVKIYMYDTNGWLGEYVKIYFESYQGNYDCPIDQWLDNAADAVQELNLECTFEA